MPRTTAPRSSRRGLPAFSHTPSRLSHSTSAHDLRKRYNEEHDEEDEDEEPEDVEPNGAIDPPPVPKVPDQFRTPSHFGTPIRTRSIGSSAHPPSPRTPEIHYSPYATSTPPSALSRSTSVPFDMAANDKAARKLEVELKQKKEVTPTPRKKRFVRRKPFLQRIAVYPQRIVDSFLLNWPPSFETIVPAAQYANPISLAIHLLHWLLLAPLLRSTDSPETVLRTEVETRWSRFDDPGESTSRTGWKTMLVTLILITVASANSIYLFTRFRLYDMQLRSGRDTAVSPHSSPVTTPHVNRKDSDELDAPVKESQARKVITVTLRGSWIVLSWLYSGILSIFGHGSGSLQNGLGQGYGGDTIQRLRVWEPPEFALHFFCAYPPSAPLLSHLLTPIHPFYTPLLYLVTSFLLSHLARSYSQLVKDRMVLSAEVMREYDQRFVYRKVFAPKVDRGVGTHEGPWYEL